MTALVFIPDYISNKKKADRFPNKPYLFIINCQETVQNLRETEWFFSMAYKSRPIEELKKMRIDFFCKIHHLKMNLWLKIIQC